MKIIIYTKSGCPACLQAKMLLNSKGIGYTEWDVGTDIGHKKMLAQVDAQYRQMPQIFIEGQRVGDKLYTSLPAQRTWVGLTDDEVDDLSREMVKGKKSVNWLSYSIEAKLKEKNT